LAIVLVAPSCLAVQLEQLSMPNWLAGRQHRVLQGMQAEQGVPWMLAQSACGHGDLCAGFFLLSLYAVTSEQVLWGVAGGFGDVSAPSVMISVCSRLLLQRAFETQKSVCDVL
jgi:hypothetical protein